jgi:hypothetical protein
MRQLQLPSVQIQRAVHEVGGKKAVMWFVAVSRVPDDGVPQVPQVQADLVVPTGFGNAFHKGEPARGIARNGNVPFGKGQWTEVRACVLGNAVVSGGEGLLCRSRSFEPPPHHRDVTLFDAVFSELGLQEPMCIKVPGKQHQAACRAVDAVHGVCPVIQHPLCNQPVAEVIGVLCRHIRPVNKQVAGLESNHQVIIGMHDPVAFSGAWPVFDRRTHPMGVRCVANLPYFARSS